LGHFVSLEGDRVLQLLVTSFLSDLPVNLGHSDGRTAGTDEGNGGNNQPSTLQGGPKHGFER